MDAAGEEGTLADAAVGNESFSCSIALLPHDILVNILLRLPLRTAAVARTTSRLFHHSLTPYLLSLLPPLPLLVLRHPRSSASSTPRLHAFDPSLNRWLSLPIPFLSRFPSFSPISSCTSLLYLWVEPVSSSTKTLLVCNPLSASYRLLPPLGSAWSRHGTVLPSPDGSVFVLTDLAALSVNPAGCVERTERWRKHPLSLPSKPRSPVLACGAIYALCDVGTPWRSQWRLFRCHVPIVERSGWVPIEREWGDVMEVLKRPRLLPSADEKKILMVGGLRSSFAIGAPCSTILIFRLDLETMVWEEGGRMPSDMYRCFTGEGAAGSGVVGGNNKVKVFGGNGSVWFSGKKVRGKLAMWEEAAEQSRNGKRTGDGRWCWTEGIPGYGEGVYRGFMFNAGFTAIP